MKSRYNKLISVSALIALSGYILSGPLAFFVVQLIHPQPPWVSPAVFVENYSAIQDLPYYFGFLLIGGMLMLAASHYLNGGYQTMNLLYMVGVWCLWKYESGAGKNLGFAKCIFTVPY